MAAAKKTSVAAVFDCIFTLKAERVCVMCILCRLMHLMAKLAVKKYDWSTGM